MAHAAGTVLLEGPFGIRHAAITCREDDLHTEPLLYVRRKPLGSQRYFGVIYSPVIIFPDSTMILPQAYDHSQPNILLRLIHGSAKLVLSMCIRPAGLSAGHA